MRGIGVFPRDVSLRDEVVRGQWTPTEMVDYYRVKAPGVRQVLIRYLTERQASIDYSSLRALAGFLAGLFWADIETHHPGIDTLSLPSEIVDPWKERMRFHLGKPGEPPRPRKEIQTIFTHVRAFYMDLQSELQSLTQDPAAATSDCSTSTHATTLAAAAAVASGRVVYGSR